MEETGWILADGTYVVSVGGVQPDPEATEVPLRPDFFYNWEGGIWVKDEQAELEDLEQTVRHQRNVKLKTVDEIAGNALRWADLNTEQQMAWATYRQALLDVPEQEGFPRDVVWPTEPEV